MNRDAKAVIAFCTASLQREPEKWSCNEYKSVHPTGVTVWHANGPDAVAVYASEWLHEGQKIGGLSAWSMLMGGGWLIPWRANLYSASRAAFEATKPQLPEPSALIRSLLEEAA